MSVWSRRPYENVALKSPKFRTTWLLRGRDSPQLWSMLISIGRSNQAGHLVGHVAVVILLHSPSHGVTSGSFAGGRGERSSDDSSEPAQDVEDQRRREDRSRVGIGSPKISPLSMASAW